MKDIKENLKIIIDNNKSKDNLGNIDLHKTRELLMDAGAVLLDVRPPAKVSGENAQEAGIANAYYTPYPSFYDSLDILPNDKTTPVVIACLNGWLANRLMGYLEMMGYHNIYVLNKNIEDLIEIHHAHADK